MPKYAVTINGHTYEVESDHELSDIDAHQAALSQLATSHDSETTAPAGPKPQPISDDEPSTYAGGFWKGLKDYGKDLVSDPRTMGMVGAGVASAALAPETGGASLLTLLAGAGLGGAGGAGVAHTVKQLRTGVPEDATDVAGSMAKEGTINAALAAVPSAARFAGPKLVARGARLAAQPDVVRMSRHAAAGAAAAMGHPSIGALIEAIQSPTVNRLAGEGLEAVGTIPEVASRLGRRVMGAEAPAVVDAMAPNSSGYRSGAPFSHVPEAPGEAMSATRPNYTVEYTPGRSTALDAEFGPSTPNTSGYVPGEEIPDAPGSISALERQMLAKPEPAPWSQPPSRSTLRFGETEQPQSLPFGGSSSSLDALEQAMAPGQTAPSSKALADVMSGKSTTPVEGVGPLRMEELRAKYNVADPGVVEQVKTGLRNLGFDTGTIARTAESAVSRGKTVERALQLALADLGAK